MLSIASASLSFAGAPAVRAPTAQPAVRMETKADLEALAAQQNIPNLKEGILDPLGFTNLNLWETGDAATIGWLRHAEIKHGRVAMAAFVGYIVHANHIVFPWAFTGGPLSTGETTMFADISAAGSPIDQWAAVPTDGKLQILGTIALLEFVGETTSPGKPHYTKGGLPGYTPELKSFDGVPHPVPFNLYDPFGFSDKRSEDDKARGRIVEINNGRGAMLGIIGFISSEKGLIVPGLDSLVTEQSDGYPMAFFSATDGKLPFVTGMLEGWNLPFH
jgi:hypothetical protein